VQREHADGELRGGFDGFGDGVGDVVELEVEEDVEAEVGDFADGIGTASGEHLETDLGPADGAGETFQDGGDLARGLGVEDENQVASHVGRAVMEGNEGDSKPKSRSGRERLARTRLRQGLAGRALVLT